MGTINNPSNLSEKYDKKNACCSYDCSVWYYSVHYPCPDVSIVTSSYHSTHNNTILGNMYPQNIEILELLC